MLRSCLLVMVSAFLLMLVEMTQKRRSELEPYEKALDYSKKYGPSKLKRLLSYSFIQEHGNNILIRASISGESDLLSMLLDHSQGSKSGKGRKTDGWVLASIAEALRESVYHKHYKCFQILHDHYLDQKEYYVIDDDEDFQEDVQSVLEELLKISIDLEDPKFQYKISSSMLWIPLDIFWKAAEYDSSATFYGYKYLEELNGEEREEIIEVAIHHDASKVLDYFLNGSSQVPPGLLLLAARSRASSCLDLILKNAFPIFFDRSELESAFMAALLARQAGMLVSFLEYFDRHKMVEHFLEYYKPVARLVFLYIVKKMHGNGFRLFGIWLSKDFDTKLVIRTLKDNINDPQSKYLTKYLPIYKLDSLKIIYEVYKGKKVDKELPQYNWISLYRGFKAGKIEEIYRKMAECQFLQDDHEAMMAYCPHYKRYRRLLPAIIHLDFETMVKIMADPGWRKSKILIQDKVVEYLGSLVDVWVSIASIYSRRGYLSRSRLYSLIKWDQ